MNSEDTHSRQTVDLRIDTNPYHYKIAKGQDAKFLRSLCDALDVGVSILDENLNYQFIGDAVFRDLGMTEGELSVGDSLSKCHELMLEKGLLTPELLERNKLSAQDQREHVINQDEDLPTIVKLGNGSTHKFIRKSLANGLTVSMSHDISELVEKDRIFEEALTLGNSGYWNYDFKTKDYYLSQSLHHYFSKEDRDKIKDQGILAIVHPEDKKLFRDAIRSLKRNNDTFEVTCRSTSYKGNERWSQTTGQIIYGPDGKPNKIHAFVKDVTRDRRQTQALEKATEDAIAASQAKSEFLANMSHEIRTPMNGILGMAELLANSNVDYRQREFINVINSSASALMTIINDILDFSKIEAGAFKIDPVPFNLKTSVNDVASLLSSHAQDKGLELIINYPTGMDTQFIGDGGRIRQVITNLIGNAIKFTEAGHIITDISVSEPRDNIAFVTIAVTDTGIGIETEKLSDVFQKFTQADGSTTRLYGGTGLGLSISKAIVEMMDGRISVKSELGKGSTFTARIPLKIDLEAVTQVFDTSILSGKYALIVDDIDVNRTLITEQLASWGIKSDSVKNGVEALNQLKCKSQEGQLYDLILLDFLMPGMNGQEMASILSGTSNLGHIPIIMLSSCDQPIPSQQLKTIGIDHFLMKPVRENNLYEAIVKTFGANQLKLNKSTRHGAKHVPIEAQAIQKMEILVAEDFSLNQDVVRLMLADTSYEPIFANNGLEALQIYKAQPDRFPVIIMDVSMPVMDGHQATSLIQQFEVDEGITPIPIIALTGHALKNDLDESRGAGMCDFLTKPVKQSELLSKLMLWTEGREHAQAVA